MSTWLLPRTRPSGLLAMAGVLSLSDIAEVRRPRTALLLGNDPDRVERCEPSPLPRPPLFVPSVSA